jgi:hypothetical protein
MWLLTVFGAMQSGSSLPAFRRNVLPLSSVSTCYLLASAKTQTQFYQTTLCHMLVHNFTLLHNLSPRANYIDRATAVVSEVSANFRG